MKFTSFLLTSTLAATYAPSVFGHGYLAQVSVDGKTFNGGVPGIGGGDANPIRLINDITPVKGANNPDIMCGKGAQPAGLSAEAKPGSNIGFLWKNGENGPWVHNIGPVMTYMASCGQRGCKSFDPSTAKWFKIHELGQKKDNPGVWGIQDMVNGQMLNVPLPKQLATGEYLVRHELLMLHVAQTQGGAEWYPGCAQIKITNGVDGAAPAPTVSLPGAYSDTDPGILVPTIFDPVKNYQFPGPAIANVAGGSPARRGVHPKRISRIMKEYRAVD